MFNSIPGRYLLATILMSVGTAFAQDHAGVAPLAAKFWQNYQLYI
jgi:hypothetical protein